MDNAADRKSIRRKEKASRLADVQRREVIMQVMSTSFGRHWMWDILASCHIFSTTFNGDPYQSAYMEGQRAAGLTMLSDIMAACPDQYIQAMRESNERHISNDNPASGTGSAEGRTGDPAGSEFDPDSDDSFIDFGDGVNYRNPAYDN